jgi:hypothetical protein
MHIEYRITERDFRDATMLSQRKGSALSALDYYLPYIFAIIWLAVATIPAYFHPEADLDLLLTLGILPIVLGLVLLRRKHMRVEYEKLRNYHLHQELDIDTLGFRLTTTQGVTRSAWQVYSCFCEDKSSFILFENGNHKFYPIPKAHLSEPECDELRTLLEARLPRQ